MTAHTLPFRQVHLDFHTSPKIEGIGANFDAEVFGKTLTDADVDAIVLFAKCHHGMAYYDTKVGTKHPGLEFDLLRAQVDACQTAGVRTPIYVSVGWDEHAAHNNPGWRRIKPDGEFHMMIGKNGQDPYWSYLCLNTPYRDYLHAQIEEVVKAFPEGDGLWLDIVFQHACICPHCQDGMTKAGLDWTNSADQTAYAEQVLQDYLSSTAKLIRDLNPNYSIFHNSSMVPRGDREAFGDFTHMEIEAVPTGGWGYDHFPISARYIDPSGLDFMGVTVRFDLIWGELGGYRHPNALRAEILTMQAHGAKVCIGDHMDVDGTLDPDTYRLIGGVYEEVKAKEGFVAETRPVADIALLSSIAAREPGSFSRDARHIDEDYGALRMLQQGGYLFDVVGPDDALEAYKLVIVPDRVRLSPDLAAKLEAYRAAGGALLLTGESALTPTGEALALDIGAAYAGPSPFDNAHIHPLPELRPDYVEGPFLAFSPTIRVKATDGESLGELYDPRFNRTLRAFSGHINTPRELQPSGFSCGVRKDRTVYLPVPVFTLYKSLGQTMMRDFTCKVIDSLLGKAKTLTSTLPAAAIATLRQDDEKLVLQTVYAPKELRGQTVLGLIEVIEDLPELHDVAFTVKTDRAIKAVTVQPDGRALPFTQNADTVSFTLDRLQGGALITLT
ncbi:MAG: beta-galactosidase trimerization domain-containing protein [Henriciella sp.]|nr:beta-galactosidase trimerization domain-containing protein [Henriciella sp.]